MTREAKFSYQKVPEKQTKKKRKFSPASVCGEGGGGGGWQRYWVSVYVWEGGQRYWVSVCVCEVGAIIITAKFNLLFVLFFFFSLFFFLGRGGGGSPFFSLFCVYGNGCG